MEAEATPRYKSIPQINRIKQDAAAGDELLGGYYSKESRKALVFTRLKVIEERFVSKLYKVKDFTQILQIDREQVKTKSIQDIVAEKDQLAADVSKYKPDGGHFDKNYRTLSGTCERLLLNIDKLDGADEEFHARKLMLIKEIQHVLSQLNSKMHETGSCCPDCSLYGTKWQ